MTSTKSGPRVLVTVPVNPAAKRLIRRELGRFGVLFAHGRLPPRAGTIEVWLTGNPDLELPGFGPEATPNLSLVQSIYAGVDRFPFDRFSPHVRIATNNSAYAAPVAEHAVALVLALAKNLPENDRRARQGRLVGVRPSTPLLGARVLILGFGAIGRAVAARLRPFGVELTVFGRATRRGLGRPKVVRHPSLTPAIRAARVVVNCLPLNVQTKGLLGRRELAALTPGSILVNVGRAGTIDPDAFRHTARINPTVRFGLDVWWDEDYSRGRFAFPLNQKEAARLIATPHVAGNVEGDGLYPFRAATENIGRFFARKLPRNLVRRADYGRRSVRARLVSGHHEAARLKRVARN